MRSQWHDLWKKHFASFKRDLDGLVARTLTEEELGWIENDLQENIYETGEDLRYLVKEVRVRQLTKEELELLGETLLEIAEECRCVEIVCGDVWEGEETVGPVTLEGMDALEDGRFENEARKYLEKVLRRYKS